MLKRIAMPAGLGLVLFILPALADTVAGAAPWHVEGTNTDARCGQSVTIIGDYDGNGFNDIAVGAPGFSTVATGEVGQVQIFGGTASGFAAAPIATINGTMKYGAFGSVVASAGDFNGDGKADLAVSVPHFASGTITDAGKVCIFFGTSSGFPTTMNQASWSVTGTLARQMLGTSLARVGDVTGDGRDELAIGTADYRIDAAHITGQVRIHAGTSASAGGGGTSAPPIWSAVGMDESDFGLAICCDGDFDGDGRKDLAIGAPNHSSNPAGAVFIFRGIAGGFQAAPDWTIRGIQDPGTSTPDFGRCLAYAGDVDGDGRQDLVVGAPSLTLPSDLITDVGAVYLYKGRTPGSPVPAPDWQVIGNPILRIGVALAAPGDIDGDGFPEIAVGCPLATRTESEEGSVLIYPGTSGGFDTDPRWIADGGSQGAHFGSAIAAGTLDGFSCADLVIGAPGFRTAPNNAKAGAAYAFYNPSAPPQLLPAMIGQYALDGTTPVGAQTNQDGFVVRGLPMDPNLEAVRLEVEVKPHLTAFDGQDTILSPLIPGGLPVTVTVRPLADGPYWWRARGINQGGYASPWAHHQAADDVDIEILPNTAPFPPVAGIFDAGSGASIGAGATLYDGAPVHLGASVTDPDGNLLRLEVEVRDSGGGDPLLTAAGDWVASGSTATLLLPLPVDPGGYYIRVRTRDERGAFSATGFLDGHDGASPDFRILPMGSIGAGKVGCSASTPAGLWLPLLAAAALALRRRAGR